MRLFSLLFAAAALAGCSDATGSGSPSGTVSFTYSGAASGTFSAAGPAWPPATVVQGTGGEHFAGSFRIAAQIPTQDARGDVVFIDVHTLSSGPQTVAFNTECPAAATPCANGYISFGPFLTAPILLAEAYWLKSGEVRFTELSETRLRGTFRGSATHFNTGAVIQVENGTFDVAVAR